MSVAAILKQHTAAFIAANLGKLSAHVESTLMRIGFCRTAAMNGRKYECPGCSSQVNLYNSCTDRHCPSCMGARRADWVDKTSQLIRPNIEYFQVVFTVPDKLSPLILGNRKLLYRLHFASAASALRRSLRDERKMQSAATMVLHTWNQRLEHHPHIHALVPGSGPSLDGQSWVPCGYTRATKSKPSKPFLVDNKKLGRKFRDSYLSGVKRLLRTAQLKIDDHSALHAMLKTL